MEPAFLCRPALQVCIVLLLVAGGTAQSGNSSAANGSSALAPQAVEQCDPPCLNGGTPIRLDVNGTTFCECQCPQPVNPGDSFFAGDRCGKPATLCSTDGTYCANNGTCSPTSWGGFRCSCRSPYYGFLCQQVGTPCGPDLVCLNNARCVVQPNGRLGCSCMRLFLGDDCGTFDANFFRARRSKLEWWYIFVGVVGACIVFVVLALALVAYFKWRKRYKNFGMLPKQGPAPAPTQVEMESAPRL